MTRHNDPRPAPVSRAESSRRSDARAGTMIDLRDVVKTFKNAAGEFTVLKGIDLVIPRGEFVAIVGKSGSGKSTLLNMITGIDHPTAGQVVIGGTDLYSMSEGQRSLWRGRNLGIVFQFFQLLPMLTLLENVMLPMDYANLYDFDERPRRAMELLQMVGLEKQAGKLPLAVSNGQQQSAAIARALANDPPLIVADEPTGNLDSRAADAIMDLFESFVRDGKTVVMVTHDRSNTSRATQTVVLSDGELVDPTVVRALPLLTYRQMMDVTKKIRRVIYQPGELILQADQRVDDFFMIVRGGVEVMLSDGRLLARMEAGEFFGEIELVHGQSSIASVHAAPDRTVELITLPRAEFLQLIKESPLTEEAIGRIVQHRLEEHEASAPLAGGKKRERGNR